MNVGSISNTVNTPLKNPGENVKTKSFSETLKEQLSEVNELQIASQKATESLAVGEAENIHEVMIQTEEAKLALELTVQVRDKVVEAYQDIMKMQI
jgi:flagellar hook-basal body complex protein FliE